MSAFDRLCWFAERFPDLVMGESLSGMLRTVPLFYFPNVSLDLLRQQISTEEEAAFQREFFAMPFQTLAIEDDISCVMLWDTSASQVGLIGQRFFVEVAPLRVPIPDVQAAVDRLDPRTRKRYESAYSFSFGHFTIKSVNPVEGYSIEGRLMLFRLLGDDGELPESADFYESNYRELGNVTLRNAKTAIEQLMIFNRPDRFIVEESPARIRPPTGKLIPRAHERPNYTLLHVAEARQKLGLPAMASSGGRFVGERRRHVRRYPDDPARWPNAHGKVIVVPAAWVGPSEAKVGRRTFKIRLDL